VKVYENSIINCILIIRHIYPLDVSNGANVLIIMDFCLCDHVSFVAVGDAAPDVEVVHVVMCVVLDAAAVPDAYTPNCCGSKNVSVNGFEIILLPWLTC
jgi:hypothetical protein